MSAVDPVQRPMGRPRRLAYEMVPTRDGLGSEPLADALEQMVRAGASVADACACISPPVHEQTWRMWMRRGRREHERIEEGAEPDPSQDDYLQFFYRMSEAEHHAKVEAILTVREAITGMYDEETTTTTVDTPVTVTNEHGVQEIVYETKTTVTTKRTKKKHWAAAMTYLERKFPAEYARRIVELVEEKPEEDIDSARERMSALLDEVAQQRELHMRAEQDAIDRGDTIDV